MDRKRPSIYAIADRVRKRMSAAGVSFTDEEVMAICA